MARKRARGSAQAAATPTPAHDDDAMDVDTSQADEAGEETSGNSNGYNELWTDDQIASLFKAVIRWKPAGMHKHFRMIAISEHLRCHGFDPDIYQHTRIPYIWQKLRAYYNLEVIDERENFDDDENEDRYNEFCLPKGQFLEKMMGRAIADPSEAPTSPPELDLSPPPSSPPPRKRKRGDTVSKTRGVSAEDTEDGTDAPSPAPRSIRGSRGRKRAASQTKTEKMEKVEKVEKAETTEEDGSEEEEEDDDDEEEEQSGSGDDDEESGTPARTTRGASRGRGKVRGRGRGRRR